MSKQQADQEFRILGKGDEDAEYIRVMEDRLDSLSWKVALMSIVIPCLIVIVIVIGYFGIRQKVTEFQDSGEATVRRLSAEMQERMDALDKGHKELSQRVEQASKSIKGNSDSIARARREISAVKSAERKLSKSIESLNKNIEGLSKRLSALDARLKELRGIADGLGQRTDVLEKDKAGRDELERVLSNNRQVYENRLDAALKELDMKIKALEKQVGKLSQQVAVSKPSQDGSQSLPAGAGGEGEQGGISEEPISR